MLPFIWVFLGLGLFPLVESAENQPGEDPAQAKQEQEDVPQRKTSSDTVRFSLGKRWRLLFSPKSDLYPRYLADITRPGFELKQMSIQETDIAETSTTRYGFKLGGRYGFFRLHPAGHPEKGFQLNGEGAFVGQFDPKNNTDNIGWDGVFGFHFTWANGRGLAMRLAGLHDSSHVGDEFAERTGRKRINYTREEWALGLSLAMKSGWRFYAESGWAYDMRNEELQRPWRVQTGLEFLRENGFFHSRIGYYGAINYGAWEERDWKGNTTIHTGLVLPLKTLARTYRVGLEYYQGRAAFGEFFQEDERWVAFGFWLEL